MKTSDPDAMFSDLKRVHTGNGSHIEPALEESWELLTKLLWHAKVFEVDTGVKLLITHWPASSPRRERFSISTRAADGSGGSSFAAAPYHSVWVMMSYMAMGIQLHKSHLGAQEEKRSMSLTIEAEAIRLFEEETDRAWRHASHQEQSHFKAQAKQVVQDRIRKRYPQLRDY